MSDFLKKMAEVLRDLPKDLLAIPVEAKTKAAKQKRSPGHGSI